MLLWPWFTPTVTKSQYSESRYNIVTFWTSSSWCTIRSQPYYLLQLFDVIKYYIDQVRSPKRPTKHINTTPHSKALINVSNKNKGSELMFCCKILCLILLCLLSYSLFSAYVVVVTSSLDFVQYKVQADYLILEHWQFNIKVGLMPVYIAQAVLLVWNKIPLQRTTKLSFWTTDNASITRITSITSDNCQWPLYSSVTAPR